MKQYVISFFNEFKCVGGSCSMSCCKGWHIAIDDETLGVYFSEKTFISGLRNRLLIKKLRGGQMVIRKCFNKCPYHTSSGLCKLQLQNRTDHIPLVCKIYPRRSIRYNDTIEATMELSCIEVARIFLEHPGKPALVPYNDGPLPYLWKMDNDDEPFLEFIDRSRQKIADYIWDDDDFTRQTMIYKMLAIYDHVFEMHKLLMADNLEEASLCLDKPIILSDRRKNGPAPTFFFPITMLNDLIFNEIYYPLIFIKNPKIFKLIKQYQHIFGGLYEDRAEEYFGKAMDDMIEKKPDLLEKYRAYLSYILFTSIKEAYEDYYLVGPMLLSFIYTSFLMIFDLTAYMANKGRLERDEEILILSSMEKALHHSVDVSDNFIRKIRAEYM